ncbi:hypothetical protein ABKV19_005023 [Rosa sericea]
MVWQSQDMSLPQLLKIQQQWHFTSFFRKKLGGSIYPRRQMRMLLQGANRKQFGSPYDGNSSHLTFKKVYLRNELNITLGVLYLDFCHAFCNFVNINFLDHLMPDETG